MQLSWTCKPIMTVLMKGKKNKDLASNLFEKYLLL